MANKIREASISFKSPALPTSPQEYNRAVADQTNNALRLYFNNVDEALRLALSIDTSDIVDGSIPNSKLENSTVSYGGITLSLGESDATPAFNLSDATNYPAANLTGTISTAQIADDAVTDAKLANSINSAIAANTAKVTNATHTGEVTGATALTIADGAVVTARIADDAVTGAKIDSTTHVNLASLTVTTSDGFLVTSGGQAILKAIANSNYSSEIWLGDIGDPDGARIVHVPAIDVMTFDLLGAEKMRLHSSGRLALGTTGTPLATLHARLSGTSGASVLQGTAGFFENDTSCYLGIGAGATNTSGINFSDSADADAGHVWYNHNYNSLSFGTAGSSRMLINGSGDVGINATTPLTKLHVSKYGIPSGLTPTPAASVFLDDTSTAALQFGSQWYGSNTIYFGRAAGNGAAADADLGAISYSNYYNALTFRVNASERMRINALGRLGLGTTNIYSNITVHNAGVAVTPPSSTMLQLRDTNSSSHINLISNNYGSTALYFGDRYDADVGSVLYSHYYNHLTFTTNASERVRINASGNMGIGTTAPTEKLDINSDKIRLRTSNTPSSASSTGAKGEICYDANYIYVCTATNTWKRVALSTW